MEQTNWYIYIRSVLAIFEHSCVYDIQEFDDYTHCELRRPQSNLSEWG